MFCQRCGSPMKEGQAFCGKCGTAVQPVTPAVQPTQPMEESVQPETSPTVQPTQPAVDQLMPVESFDGQFAIEEATPAKKKIWPKIVFPIIALVVVASVVMAVIMNFFVVTEDDVIGKWKGEFDYQELMEASNTNMYGFEFSGQKLLITLEFHEDHTATLTFDKDSFLDTMNQVMDYSFATRYDEIQNILKPYNITFDQARQAMIDFYTTYIDTMAEKSFKWRFEDGKVYVNDKSDRWIEVDGDTMQFHYDEDGEWAENASQEEMDAAEILVFTRVDD